MYICVEVHSYTATYAASAGLHVPEKAGVQPRLQSKPALKDFGLQPYSHTQPQSAVFIFFPVFHVTTWITTHLPSPEGWKAELAWVDWHIVDSFTRKVITSQP